MTQRQLQLLKKKYIREGYKMGLKEAMQINEGTALGEDTRMCMSSDVIHTMFDGDTSVSPEEVVEAFLNHPNRAIKRLANRAKREYGMSILLKFAREELANYESQKRRMPWMYR